MSRKIGILGGTFNPIHNGHILLGEVAHKQLHLDQIWFMPSGQTNLKKDLYILSKEHRRNLILLSIEEYPYFYLSDLELNRAGTTYTYETLLELKQLYPEDSFYFILGADCLFSIEKWKEPSKIMSQATLVSAIRGDSNICELNEQANYLKDKFGAQIKLLKFDKIDISSSKVRAKIKNNEPLSGMVPDKVADYIYKHHLFEGIETI